MATKLSTFDFSAPSNLTATNGDEKAAYPWEEWFDGDIWQLTVGEDFEPHPLMMERIIRTRATGRRAKVRVRHLALNGAAATTDPTGIIVMERTDIDGPNQSKRAAKAAATRERRAAKKAAAPAAAAEAIADLGLAKKAPSKARKAPAKRPTK